MRAVLAFVCLLVLPGALAEVGKCLKSWGVILGLREEALNKALLERLIRRVPAGSRTINAEHIGSSGKNILLMGVGWGFVTQIYVGHEICPRYFSWAMKFVAENVGGGGEGEGGGVMHKTSYVTL